MSQPPNSTDTQALVQSMLQRLKLQPGRESQSYLHSHAALTAASTQGQNGKSGATSLQKVSNDFKFAANGIPSKEFGISAADGVKGNEIQQPDHGSEADRTLISFHSQKDNSDGENRVGQPGITPTGTKQLFPTKPLKDADITSFAATDRDRASFGSSGMTVHTPQNTDTASSMGQSQKQDQGFTPRVYVWSLKSTDTGAEGNQVLHMGNGGAAGLTQDAQNTANSSMRRKPRSSENKTRRWTQRIKDRWRDRPGSFGKKEKEEGEMAEQKNEQSTEASTVENVINTSNKDGERSLSSLDSTGPSKTHTEDTTDAHVRSTSDFDFGLGSFSLLEEIVKGQEWAKFLNPNLPSTPAASSEELLRQTNIQPNPQDSNQAPGILNQFGSGSNRWSFRSSESSPGSAFSVTQTSPEAFSPVSMDVSEGHREADQSEPMEDGQNQSRLQQLRPPSFTEPVENPYNPTLKSRGSSNRKRQHQSAGRSDDRLQTEKTRDGEGSISSLSSTSSHAMDATAEPQHNNVIPLYSLNSPSFPKPLAPAPRGVLKHSISQDSESSMETVTKRRRVEENRRVRFLEEVVTIEPPELDLDVTDSEEDSAADEDSVTEQEVDVEPAAMEEAAPARRPALPAWIQALKRKNTGRKHR